MKITDENLIKNGEKELIDRIYDVVDWDSIKNIFKEKYRIKIQDDRKCRQGDIVVHNNGIAYNLEFDVKATISVLFDRSGNYLALTTATHSEEDLSQADLTQPETVQNKTVPPPLFTYVEETKTDEEEIIELTDIVNEEIIELTDIVMDSRVAA